MTDKQIIDVILELQSHSGLPIKIFNSAASYMFFLNKMNLEINPQEIINKCMIKIHNNNKRSSVTLKSYDW